MNDTSTREDCTSHQFLTNSYRARPLKTTWIYVSNCVQHLHSNIGKKKSHLYIKMPICSFWQMYIFSTPGRDLESLPTVWTCIFSPKKPACRYCLPWGGFFFTLVFLYRKISSGKHSKKKHSRRGEKMKMILFFHCK